VTCYCKTVNDACPLLLRFLQVAIITKLHGTDIGSTHHQYSLLAIRTFSWPITNPLEALSALLMFTCVLVVYGGGTEDVVDMYDKLQSP